MTAHNACDLPIEQCPQWEPHPSHDHSPVASKHCAGVEPMSRPGEVASLTELVERFAAWCNSLVERMTAGESPGDGRTLDADEVAPTADGRRVWIPNSESADASLEHATAQLRVFPPVSDVPKTAPIKVTWTGEIDDQCDFPRCHNWSTHDVETHGAVHRSCDVHLADMIRD